jgi:Na+-transporting methylmalonyl-CoA/oxaloacetate decarboxylase gamma subunit
MLVIIILIILIIIIKFIGYLFYSMVGGAVGRNFKNPPRKLIIEKVLFFLRPNASQRPPQ